MRQSRVGCCLGIALISHYPNLVDNMTTRDRTTPSRLEVRLPSLSSNVYRRAAAKRSTFRSHCLKFKPKSKPAFRQISEAIGFITYLLHMVQGSWFQAWMAPRSGRLTASRSETRIQSLLRMLPLLSTFMCLKQWFPGSYGHGCVWPISLNYQSLFYGKCQFDKGFSEMIKDDLTTSPLVMDLWGWDGILSCIHSEGVWLCVL